jgi:hypothetical protein
VRSSQQPSPIAATELQGRSKRLFVEGLDGSREVSVEGAEALIPFAQRGGERRDVATSRDSDRQILDFPCEPVALHLQRVPLFCGVSGERTI